jgi:hypothetical protein
MAKGIWIRGAALAAAVTGLALTGTLLACGPKQEEMSHGDTVDNEVAMPTDPNEMRMTEEQRRAKAAAQEEAQEQREFNDSDQGDNAPGKP